MGGDIDTDMNTDMYKDKDKDMGMDMNIISNAEIPDLPVSRCNRRT
jgi:hypothetical protein